MVDETTPILRTPYEEPVTYYMLDARGRATNEIQSGRRPSESTIGMPDEEEVIFDPDNVEPHKTINHLRNITSRWRSEGWPGTTTRTRKLLDFWHQSDPGIGMRPFWCQMESIETMIWLFEAGKIHDSNLHKKMMHKLTIHNDTYNDKIPRTAFKMATGSGKTNVMAMTMLWMLVNNMYQDEGGIMNFLVITPNLTVKKRLEVLNPKSKTELWYAITPREFHRMLNRIQVTIVNFHVFQRRIVAMSGKSLGAKEKAMLGKANVANFQESEEDMINRVLHGHDKKSRIIVINDEAHHCYKSQQETRYDSEYKEYQEAAALWFNALKLLEKYNRLAHVYDFSATPMWLVKPRNTISEIFPWTVSDFPLLDAIESGLVKIPRVPVEDDTESYQPKYRNIYEYNSGKPLTKNLVVRVQEPLKQLYQHYIDVVNPAYYNVGIIPIFIIVANNINNAAAIYRWVAGSYNANNGRGIHGHLDMFSNYDKNGNPRQNPPTLLVHSRLFDKTPTSGQEKEMLGEQAMLFGLEGSQDKKQEQIRNLFTSVGQGDARHIRCVISVGMLTEGWDAKNVTHVFGYRRFGSMLLCEQVTGRALRRTSFVGPRRQDPEYANVFGVPYTFARGGDVPPQPPVQAYSVFSVSGKERFRISFPNVIGYENPKQQRRFEINHQKVKPYVVKSEEPKKTKVKGPTGSSIVVIRDRREQTAIWDTASRVSTLLSRDSNVDNSRPYVMVGRRLSFVDSCQAVREWLSHPHITCTDVAGVMADSHVPQKIAEACDYKDETLKIQPIFADENQSGERFRTTEDISFRTTLEHSYPSVQRDNKTLDTYDVENDHTTFLKKSELNRAACHSHEEVQIAKILDGHSKIESWARNFRLDFKIPWFDESQNAWRHMDPDFVARVKSERGVERYLVIEFKGMKQGESEEQAKKYYMENWWCPAVSEYDDGKYGIWKSVWIEDINSARRQINEACVI